MKDFSTFLDVRRYKNWALGASQVAQMVKNWALEVGS